MSKTVKVRAKHQIVFSGGSAMPGEVCEVPESDAKDLIALEAAELVVTKDDEKKAASEVKKATAEAKKNQTADVDLGEDSKPAK